jgi:hydroxymethylpyrimidine/phosphomethylpyrimidine kinase
MIKEIKSFLEKKTDGTTTLTTTAVLQVYDHYVVEAVYKEVINRCAEAFLSENEEAIKRDILDNPKFADALYNAIVLKKAGKELV